MKELFLKHQIFNGDAINSIYNSYSELFQNKYEVKQLILGNCETKVIRKYINSQEEENVTFLIDAASINAALCYEIIQTCTPEFV